MLASVSEDTIRIVCERVSKGDTVSYQNDDERKILKLMAEVNAINANVPCSVASKVNMCNEIRGLIISKGLPSFYLTLNPADVHNPIVRLLSGAEINVDHIIESLESSKTKTEQRLLVAKNPVVAAEFFNLYMTKFCELILGYCAENEVNEGGVLGHVSAYYGCVEAQGRGSLHCHMLVWISGALNCDEIR
ncbi:hypothetical protein HYPSUDRAFT_128517, partial [Hypholoma sublateritium FD-334 SS-4]